MLLFYLPFLLFFKKTGFGRKRGASVGNVDPRTLLRPLSVTLARLTEAEISKYVFEYMSSPFSDASLRSPAPCFNPPPVDSEPDVGLSGPALGSPNLLSGVRPTSPFLSADPALESAPAGSPLPSTSSSLDDSLNLVVDLDVSSSPLHPPVVPSSSSPVTGSFSVPAALVDVPSSFPTPLDDPVSSSLPPYLPISPVAPLGDPLSSPVEVCEVLDLSLPDRPSCFSVPPRSQISRELLAGQLAERPPPCMPFCEFMDIPAEIFARHSALDDSFLRDVQEYRSLRDAPSRNST